MKKRLYYLFIFIIGCLSLLGCGDSKTVEKALAVKKIEDETAHIDSTSQNEWKNNNDSVKDTITEEITEYMEWVDQSRLNIDIDSYDTFEMYLQAAIAKNEEVSKRSFEGTYELEIMSNGSILKFKGNEVGEADPLYKELTSSWPNWREKHLLSEIENLILSIKSGEVIRTSDPADYLKKD